MKIIGISAFYHDSAAALISDGEIIAAAQEERFSRKKHDPRFPAQALEYCLEAGEIKLSEVDRVTFYDKPFLTFERLMETYTTFAPKGFSSFKSAFPLWIKQKLFLKQTLLKELGHLDPNFQGEDKLLFSEHHLSHAASAFYPSPFREALVLTMDGVGEWATSSISVGKGNKLDLIAELEFPHSLGLLYSAFTYYTGFKVNSGEYKVMGLAPYGEPIYKKRIMDNILDLKEDGSFKLNMAYFNFHRGLTMTSEKFHKLFDGPPRKNETTITQKEMDLARSIQEVLEEIVLKITAHWVEQTGIKNVCLAGGVSMNCKMNCKKQIHVSQNVRSHVHF